MWPCPPGLRKPQETTPSGIFPLGSPSGIGEQAEEFLGEGPRPFLAGAFPAGSFMGPGPIPSPQSGPHLSPPLAGVTGISPPAQGYGHPAAQVQRRKDPACMSWGPPGQHGPTMPRGTRRSDQERTGGSDQGSRTPPASRQPDVTQKVPCPLQTSVGVCKAGLAAGPGPRLGFGG